ncbi:MAG TPA: hypothetical protein VHI93_00145, partial [Candidatus Thermoplasmatota archaeon]|nr:hypothetical protein [Candidatus Thermoplasmatota archaeon]
MQQLRGWWVWTVALSLLAFAAAWHLLRFPLPSLDMLLVFTAVSAVVAWLEHTWNQRRETMEIANRWNDGQVASSRLLVRRYFPSTETGVIPLQTLRHRFKEHDELETSVLTLLNHLDIVSMGVRTRIFNRRLVRHLYGDIIPHYFTCFQELVLEQYER